MTTMERTNQYVSQRGTIDLIGLFVGITRERFNEVPAGFPWKWDVDRNLTKIFIDAGGVDTYESNDARPGIFIDRSTLVYSKLLINDLANFNLATGAKDYMCRSSGQVAIDCISKNRGESSQLADMVGMHLLMADDVFRSVHNIQDIGPITVQNTQPWEKDDRVFVTRVTCEFSYDMSWRMTPTAQRLEKIRALILPS
jgi:hypothetical protein